MAAAMTATLMAFMTAASALISSNSYSHDGNLNEEPWNACGDRKIADYCSFTNSHEDLYFGTCQSMSGALICVRNKPIVRSMNSSSAQLLSHMDHNQLELSHNQTQEDDHSHESQ